MASAALIVAYVCFAIGALLILLGFIRISWFACVVRKEKKKKKNLESIYSNASLFSSQHNDPWLRENPTLSNRLEISNRGYDNFKDVDVKNFSGIHNPEFYPEEGSLTESQINGSPKSRGSENYVEHVYHTIPRDGILHGREVRIDSDTLQRNARYEEPNTNIVLAKKHLPASELPIEQRLGEVNLKASIDYEQTETVSSPRSAVDPTEAFTALDEATAGNEEDIAVIPNISRQESGDLSLGSSTPTAMSFVSTQFLVAGEPLPGNKEVDYKYESTSTRM